MKLPFLYTLIFFLIPLKLLATPYEKSTALKACDPKINKALSYKPTATTALDLKKLPYHCDGNVKVFELRSEVVFSSFYKGFEPGNLYTWGFNGSNPGPLIEAIEGETIRVEFTNHLPEPTTVHWHGIELPIEMDGASGFSHPPVKPGSSYTYEFPLKQHGTYMYHSGHMIAKQLALGMAGFFIIHGKEKPAIEVDKDYALFLQMWTIPPHSIIPDTMDMMFNFFTINGKSAPSTSALDVKLGEKVRLRFANISMMQHPIHLHGHTWKVVATGAGDNPESTFTKGNTVLVPVGQTMDTIIEEVHEKGNWLLHCHLPHHVTNNMEIDPVPGEMMSHGEAGMFTLFNVSSEGEDPPHKPHKMPHKMGGPRVGFYEGHIALDNGRHIKTQLHLYKAQKENEWRKLEAHLRLVMGEQTLDYSYENIKYNFETETLSFDDGNRRPLLFNLKTMVMGGGGGHHHMAKPMVHLMGDFKSPYEGISGKIHLNLNKEAKGHHLLGNLEGQYSGKFEGSDSKLQLYFMRGLGEFNSQESNPFSDYAISGIISLKDRVEATLEKVSFNPFTGKMNFILARGDFKKATKCQFNQVKMSQSIDCGDFSFHRKVMHKPSQHHKNINLTTLDKVITSKRKITQLDEQKSISGNYQGHLIPLLGNKLADYSYNSSFKVIVNKHETKPMRIPTPKVSGILTININGEKLSYRFLERALLDSSSMATKAENKLTFESDLPVSLIVSHWSLSGLKATLIHHHLGPIAKVYLSKNEALSLPDNITHAKGFASTYSLNNERLQIKVLNLDDDISDHAPNNPVFIKAVLSVPTTRIKTFYDRGSFNPFSGELALISTEGAILKGHLNPKTGDLYLKRANKPQRRVRVRDSELVLYKRN